jgi:hypothetical protein
MAAIEQRLALFFTANAGQAMATMGRLSGSILSVGTSARQSGQQTGWMGQQMGRVNSQMRTLGTTMKWAFSGAAVYGTMNMVRNLSQFQQQLGLISSTARLSGIQLTGDALTKMSQQIMGASVETIQPIQDVTDAVINYIGHVQGQPVNQIVPSLIAISKAAKLSLTPVEDVTVAMTTMNRAFGLPITTQNIERLSAKWATFVSIGPATRGVGPKIIQQMGGLASAARMARIDPGQLFTMLLANLQFGINPQQTSTGLKFLLQQFSVGAITGTSSQRAAFAALGVTPDLVQQQGGYRTLLDVFKKIQGMGGIRNPAAVTRQLTTSNLNPNDVAALGIGGPGLATFATLFKSRYALRNAIALYEIWKSGLLEKDLAQLGDSVKSVAYQQHNFAKAWDDFSRQSQLAKAAQALQAMQYQIATSIAPILNFAVSPIPWVQKEMLRHATITKYASEAAFSVLGVLGINKLLGGPIGKIMGRIPGINRFGFGSIGSAAINTKIAEDVVKGMTNPTPGLSPENPLYVVVVKSIIPDKGTTTSTTDPTKPGFWDKYFPKVLPIFKSGGLRTAAEFGFKRILGPLGIGLGAAWTTKELAALFGEDLNAPRTHALNFPHGMSFTSQGAFLKKMHQGGLFGFGGGDVLGAIAGAGPARDIAIAKALHTTYQNVQLIERYLSTPGIQRILKDGNEKLLAQIQNQGLGGLTLDLTIVQDGKAVAKKRVHLPPDTYSGGATPGARGRKKTMKTTVQGH